MVVDNELIGRELSTRITTAGLRVEEELQSRIVGVQVRSGLRPRTFDELDRTIDEVADESLRHRLRRLAVKIEQAAAEFQRCVGEVSTHDLFDPLRIVATDLRHDL